MSDPNTPQPEEPNGPDRQQPGQGGTGENPPPGPEGGGHPGHQPGYGPPSGGYPPPGGHQRGGFEPSSATTGQPNQNERQMGLIAHLGGGLAGFFISGFGWIVPLIIYLIKKDESPFVRDQAAQALNFQILITIGVIVSWLLVIVFFIGLLVWPIVAVLCLVFGILGGVAANKGEWYRYPINVDWVK